MNPALDKLAEIEALEQRATDLRTELKHSLMLQELWPDVFAHGPVTTQATGNYRHNAGILFAVKNGIGNTREFNILDIPIALWPKALQTEMENTTGLFSQYKIARHYAKHKGQS
jgi:hypothetical protein